MTREEISHLCWHNYGENRWFDKSIQLIVFQNGRAGFLGYVMQCTSGFTLLGSIPW